MLHGCLYVVFILSHNSSCASGEQDWQDREGKLKERNTVCVSVKRIQRRFKKTRFVLSYPNTQPNAMSCNGEMEATHSDHCVNAKVMCVTI